MTGKSVRANLNEPGTVQAKQQSDRTPTTVVPEEAVEAAADAIVDAAFGQELPEAAIDLARAALEAAAPFIAAKALEDAADALDELWGWRRSRFDLDWADGVEESEVLVRARAAAVRGEG